jgi:3-hydroxybutyryl-CoA dehydrogenase
MARANYRSLASLGMTNPKIRITSFREMVGLQLKRSYMEIKKVGVLGCGLMGSGIAQVCATAGFDVTVLEVEQKYLDKGFAGIEKSLGKFAERAVEKGGITPQQKDEIRARLTGTTNKADLAYCDIVIEDII